MGTMRDAVDTALGDAELPNWAAPTAELARRYADLIDQGDGGVLLKVGPRLESALARLGLTAATRGPAGAADDQGGDDHADPRRDAADDLEDRARDRRATARAAAVAAAHA